jgi:hypothetical protein
MNCQQGCKFLIEWEKVGGEKEFFCQLLPNRSHQGVIRCSAFEPKVVKDDKPKKG